MEEQRLPSRSGAKYVRHQMSDIIIKKTLRNSSGMACWTKQTLGKRHTGGLTHRPSGLQIRTRWAISLKSETRAITHPNGKNLKWITLTPFKVIKPRWMRDLHVKGKPHFWKIMKIM